MLGPDKEMSLPEFDNEYQRLTAHTDALFGPWLSGVLSCDIPAKQKSTVNECVPTLDTTIPAGTALQTSYPYRGLPLAGFPNDMDPLVCGVSWHDGTAQRWAQADAVVIYLALLSRKGLHLWWSVRRLLLQNARREDDMGPLSSYAGPMRVFNQRLTTVSAAWDAPPSAAQIAAVATYRWPKGEA